MDEMRFEFSTRLFNHFVELFALTGVRCPFIMFQLNLEKQVLHCRFNIGLVMVVCL